MALPAHNGMILYTTLTGGYDGPITHALRGDFELFDRAREEKHSEPTGWIIPNDSWLSERLSQEQPPQNPYYQNAMDWSENENIVSGSVFINATIPSEFEIHTDDDNQESSDRLLLLAKKYASETANLSKEENARLEMINQSMDLRFPRYSTKDWKLLNEAKTLIGELSSISGTKS